MLTRTEAYELYLKSLTLNQESNNESDKEVVITERYMQMFEKALKKTRTRKIKKTPITKKEAGEVFVILDSNLYFVLSNTEQYPYEVFIASPFWELASNKDLIVEMDDGTTWVLESIIRYVNNELIDNTAKIGEFSKQDIEIMKNFLTHGKELPENRKGFTLPHSESNPIELFRRKEVERSLFLTVHSIFSSYTQAKIPETVVIDMENSLAEQQILKEASSKLAATSFENFISTEFGELIKDKKHIIVNFKKELVGSMCKVYIHGEIIYEGILPKQLNITTNIKHIEDIEDKLLIEIL